MTPLPQLTLLIWTGIFLLILSISDIRTRTVSLASIVLYAVGFILISGYLAFFSPDLITQKVAIHGALFGIATVTFLLLIRTLFKKFPFEMADILMFSGVVGTLGLGRSIIFGGVLTIIATIVYVLQSKKIKTIPFAPLLLTSYLITVTIWELSLKFLFLN